MKRQHSAPVARQVGSSGASISRPDFKAGLVLLACVIPATAIADPVNLVRNGDFSANLDHWVKASEFGVVEPVTGGALSIYRPMATYAGPVVSQSIHATGIANVPVTVAAKLRRVFAPSDSSARICLEFTRGGGVHESVAVIRPANSAYAAGGAFSQFSSSFTFPADAEKLIRVTVEITGSGSFQADDLTVTGEVVPGLVPEITTVSPSTAAYGQPVTISGSHFGSDPGELAIGGSSANLTINSWSDNQIVFRMSHPSHGGTLVLTHQEVSANQTPEVQISSPHYQLRNPTPRVMAIPGQTVEVNAWVEFFNGYTSPAGIQLALQGSGGTAVFSPNPVRNQGGSRLGFSTTGLPPGVHSYTITPTDQGVPGNPVPFSVDIRVPETLNFQVVDMMSGNYPVTGTLLIGSHSPVRTDYTLLDTNATDITSASPLVWTSSNPAVLSVLPPPNTAEGPALIPMTTGTCSLTATASNGFSRTIPVSVDLETSQPEIEQIGFRLAEMDNSGEGEPNIFTAVASEGRTIDSTKHSGFDAVNRVYHQYGSTSTMEFQVPQGLTPGLYEFSADTTMTGYTRSALLKVNNAAGTGMLSGSVSKSFPNITLKAGVLEFYGSENNELLFLRDVAAYGDFKLGFIPPGTYRIRFVPDRDLVPFPLDSPWFANGTSIENAQTVTVSADETTAGVHFFVFEAPQTHAAIVIPQISGPVRDGNRFSFGFASLTGLRYTAEYSETLAPGDWHPFTTIPGDGSPKTVTDTNASGISRFYRLSVTAE